MDRFTVNNLRIQLLKLNENLDSDTGVELVNNSIDFDVLNLKLYLNDTDRRIIQRYLPRCILSAYNPNKSIGVASVSVVDRIQFDGLDIINIGDWIYIGNEWNQIKGLIAGNLYETEYEFSTSYSAQSFLHTSDNAAERIKPEVPDNDLIDLFEVNLQYKYNKIDYTGY